LDAAGVPLGGKGKISIEEFADPDEKPEKNELQNYYADSHLQARPESGLVDRAAPLFRCRQPSF
jgi:hypothetical protein